MDTAYGKQFPWCGGKAQEERHQAAYADRHQVDPFQTEPVGGPSGEWLQPYGHGAVQCGKNTDFREAEPQMTSVKRQSEANQAETEAREQTLAHDRNQRNVDLPADCHQLRPDLCRADGPKAWLRPRAKSCSSGLIPNGRAAASNVAALADDCVVAPNAILSRRLNLACSAIRRM